MAFSRFQTGFRCRSTGRALGIFHAAGRLQDEGKVEPWLEEPLSETLRWFNQNLPVPNRARVPSRCLFWFDLENSQLLGKIWELKTWLEQHDVYVDQKTVLHPGKVFYQDAFQVGAIPNNRVMRLIRLKKIR